MRGAREFVLKKARKAPLAVVYTDGRAYIVKKDFRKMKLAREDRGARNSLSAVYKAPQLVSFLSYMHKCTLAQVAGSCCSDCVEEIRK